MQNSRVFVPIFAILVENSMFYLFMKSNISNFVKTNNNIRVLMFLLVCFVCA